MKVKTFYAALAVLAIALGSVTTAMADDITADVLTYDGKAKVVTAKGNVVIHANEGATITAADGEYHFEGRSVFLEGGVHYAKNQETLTADKLFLYNDKTARGIGSVYYYDDAENRTLKGDDVMYNSDTGFAKIEGNGYLESPDGSLAAPHIEGNLKQIKVVATGGVNLQAHSIMQQATAIRLSTPEPAGTALTDALSSRAMHGPCRMETASTDLNSSSWITTKS